MLVRQNGLFLLAAALWCASCGDDSGAPQDAEVDAGNEPDAAAERDGGVELDAKVDADADAEVDPDAPDADADAEVEEVDPTILTNFSFEKAKHIDLGARGTLQPLESSTQVDYFAFEAEAGEVYAITTNRGRFTPNNVIAFHGPDREKLAENDVGWVWPGDLVDARLVVRARETGLHYVVVEDRVLPEEAFTTDGVPTLYYRVTVTHVEASTPAFSWESSGDGDEPALVAFADDEATGVQYVTLIGQLSEGDVDLFQLHGRPQQVLVGHVLPGGASGNGSTALDGLVDVRDFSDHVVASIDRASGAQHLHPPVTDADYTLSVRADGALGDNAFYAIDLVLLTDNPSEQATDNDTPETAQPIELVGGFLRRGSLLAELPALDLDYFAFEAQAGDFLDLVCEGQSAGSGVRGFHAEFRDASEVVLGEANEHVDEGLRISGAMVETAGTYYLRLSSETPDDVDAAPAWVRCAVIAEP